MRGQIVGRGVNPSGRRHRFIVRHTHRTALCWLCLTTQAHHGVAPAMPWFNMKRDTSSPVSILACGRFSCVQDRRLRIQAAPARTVATRQQVQTNRGACTTGSDRQVSARRSVTGYADRSPASKWQKLSRSCRYRRAYSPFRRPPRFAKRRHVNAAHRCEADRRGPKTLRRRLAVHLGSRPRSRRCRRWQAWKWRSPAAPMSANRA